MGKYEHPDKDLLVASFLETQLGFLVLLIFTVALILLGVVSVFGFYVPELGTGAMEGVLVIIYAILFLFIVGGLNRIRDTHDYLMYLADGAKRNGKGGGPDISKRIRHLKWFMRGVKRVGNVYTHRHLQELVLKGLRGRRASTPMTLTIDEITDTIELKVIEEASNEEEGKIHEAFERALSGPLFATNECKVSSYADFLVEHYLTTDIKIIEQASAAYERKRRLSSENLERLKTYVPIITAGVTAVLAILTWLVENLT